MIICEDTELADAAEFFAKLLKLPDDSIVAISVYDKLDVEGYCMYRDDDLRPYCMVGLRNSHIGSLLEVLSHEMVHVKQYLLGELEDHADITLWKGTEYQDTCAIGSAEYFFQPWEVEAFGMQVGLLHLYNDREVEETRVLH